MPASYQKLLVLFLLTAVWVVISEQLSVLSLAGGLFFATVSLALLHQLRHDDERSSTFVLRPLWLMVYFIYLIGQIYLSGLQMIGRIIRGRLESEVVEIETQLDSDLAISVLALSITLTPGTVTVSRRGQTLTILRAVPARRTQCSIDRQIKKSLEILLLRQRKHVSLRRR